MGEKMKTEDNMKILVIICSILLLFVAVTPTYVASKNNSTFCVGKNPTLSDTSAQGISLEKKNLRTLESGWSYGSLYMNDCGQPHGGFEYAADYYANLSVHDCLGTLHFEIGLGLGDHLLQHDFSVELLRYSYEEMSFLMDGNLVVMERIENDTIWDTWHGYYIASHESDLPNRSSIGVISPDYFPGLPSHYYVELRFPGLSSFTCTQLDVVDNPVNVSYGYGINNHNS